MIMGYEKRLRLRFLGRDGSMGYKLGVTYNLILSIDNDKVRILAPYPCPYTWRGFWQNWDTGPRQE